MGAAMTAYLKPRNALPTGLLTLNVTNENLRSKYTLACCIKPQ